jgi:hypothetical protein
MAYRRRAALLAMATSFTLAGLGAGGVASAPAADATLSIQRFQDEYGTYNYVTVQGTVSAWYGWNSRVVVRLWGDDRWSDDLLDGPANADYFDGWYFVRSFWVSDSTLDEDWDGQDEIYAGIRVYDSAGRQRETAETNRVYDHW